MVPICPNPMLKPWRETSRFRLDDVATEIRKVLKYIPAERLVVSNDCGFGRQGCKREIAFYKASALARACNIVHRQLGLSTTYVPAADPKLQIDVVPGRYGVCILNRVEIRVEVMVSKRESCTGSHWV